MTKIDTLKRLIEAQPDNVDARIDLILAEARLDGPDVYLRALKSHEDWNQTPSPIQDLAILEVERRLQRAGFYFAYTHVWSCDSDYNIERCMNCYHSLNAHVINEEELDIYWQPYPDGPDVAFRCSVCGCEDGDTVEKFSYRLATFAHEQSDIELNLLPGNLAKEKWCDHGSPPFFDSDLGCFSLDCLNVEPFLMGRWPATCEQANRLGAGINHDDPDLPLVNCPRETAEDILAKGSMRLPTPYEWRFASTNGSLATFYFGDDLNEQHVWYEGNSRPNSGSQSDFSNDPIIRSPLIHDGLGIHNAFGLVDMVGNVWEWVGGDDYNAFGGAAQCQRDFFLRRRERGLCWFRCRMFNPCNFTGFRPAMSIPDVK